MSSLKNALFAGVAALALGAGSASAATISFSFSNPLATTEIAQSGVLSLFDPSLGTLTGVEIRTSGTARTQLTFTNDSPQDHIVQATATVEVSFTSSLPGLLLPVVSVSIPTGPILVEGMGTAAAVFGPVTRTETTGTFPPPPPLGSFVGLGNFTIDCTSLSGVSLLGGGGNVTFAQATAAGCGAEVIYTYRTEQTPVPGPAALALFGMGLLGLGVVARRRAA